MSPVEEIDGKIDAKGEFQVSDSFWKKLEEHIDESPLFDELEKTLKEPEPLSWYDIRDYDLSKARNDEPVTDFPGDGDIVLVISYTGKAEIKFDSPNSDAFDLETYRKIKHTYSSIYLSNTAQSGATIKILFGRGNWDLTETIPEIDLSGTVRNDYLEQITDPLKIGQIIKDGHIIPHADIACEKVLVSGTTRLDQWRSTQDYTYIAPGKILLHSTTKLSDWRHPSDLTLINGGQIFAHSIEADKLLIARHILSGATWTDNSPLAGYVAWSGAKVTYNGATYTITDGNTNKKYIWWDFSLSTTTFQTSDTQPTLTDDDLLVAYNNGGLHILVWNATLVDGRNIKTGTISADKYLELRNTYVFSDQDSLDTTYPFEMDFEIVSEMTAIQSVKLSFRIRNFRAYATGVPSGGGHTTPSGGGHTTPAGGGHTSSAEIAPSGGGHTTPAGGGSTSGAQGSASGGGHTTPSGGGHTTPAGGGHTSSSTTHGHAVNTSNQDTDHYHKMNIYSGTGSDGVVSVTVSSHMIYNTITTGYLTTGNQEGSHAHTVSISASGSHSHTVENHQHSVSDHTHIVSNHTHPNHTHTTPNHTHTVSDHTHPAHSHTVENHQHSVSDHTHTVSDHTHSLTFGIYEDIQAPTIHYHIDNGAGYGGASGDYNSNQLDIDITAQISGTGFKQIKFDSNARTRISAWVLCKVDLTA